MTLSEFKAWFEGFSEGIDKVPTEKQFAKIAEKVRGLEPERKPLGPIPRDKASWGNQVIGRAVGGSGGITYGHIDPASKGDNQTEAVDMLASLRDLGRFEAMN